MVPTFSVTQTRVSGAKVKALVEDRIGVELDHAAPRSIATQTHLHARMYETAWVPTHITLFNAKGGRGNKNKVANHRDVLITEFVVKVAGQDLRAQANVFVNKTIVSSQSYMVRGRFDNSVEGLVVIKVLRILGKAKV